MPLIHSANREAVSENIRRERSAGKPQRQAVAIALSVADRARAAKRAAGGPTPAVPTYQTAAPAVNAAGLVPVPAVGDVTMDTNTGALTPGSVSFLQNFAQRGLPISGASSSMSQQSQQDQINAAVQAALAAAQPPPQDTFQPAGPQKRGGAVRLANGGVPSVPWFVRRESSEMDHPEGLIHSAVPGRTDRIPMSVAAGSYVVPADVMAGLGQGNTLAGAHAMEMALHTGPGGTRLPTGPHGGSMPRAPRMARGGVARERGGVPVIVAGGEWIVGPHTAARIGGGDLKRGHEKLDRWVVERRAHQVKQIKNLPGPVKK